MEFPQCKVKSAKLNMATGEISISFSMEYNNVNLEAAVALSSYIDEKRGKVEVQVTPDQPPLQGMFPTSETIEEKDDDPGDEEE